MGWDVDSQRLAWSSSFCQEDRQFQMASVVLEDPVCVWSQGCENLSGSWNECLPPQSSKKKKKKKKKGPRTSGGELSRRALQYFMNVEAVFM